MKSYSVVLKQLVNPLTANTDLKEFCSGVASLLNTGYSLHGDLSMQAGNGIGIFLAQALTKEEPETNFENME